MPVHFEAIAHRAPIRAVTPGSAPRAGWLPSQSDAPSVVHVVVAGECGGAERFLVELASRPTETRARHAIALMTPSSRLVELFEKAGLRVHDRGRLRENPLAYLWRSLGWSDVEWLAAVMRSERATIAHLHTFQSHVVGTRAARRTGARVVRTEHDTRYFVDRSCSAFTRWSLRRTDRAVAVSADVERFMRSRGLGLGSRVRTIRNGVDTRHFAPIVAERADKPFTFGLLCRLEPVKQAHLVLEAVARLEGVRLEIIGDGSELANLRRLATRLRIADRVVFHGFRRDPRDILAGVDVVVSASRSESLGLSLLEAQAMGRPVIAFGVGGVPEIVVDGVTGWVLRQHTVDALVACMSAASEDRSRSRAMGAAARRYVESEHAVERMCASYADIYAELGSDRERAAHRGH